MVKRKIIKSPRNAGKMLSAGIFYFEDGLMLCKNLDEIENAEYVMR